MTQGAQQSSQKTKQGQSTKQKHRQPKRSDLVFHVVKTGKLVGSVMTDKRVPVIRKVAYVGIVGFMLAILLFPEAFADIIALIPTLGLGDLIGIPAEGAFDWAAFAVASFELLRLFPTEIIGEHYDRLFRR